MTDQELILCRMALLHAMHGDNPPSWLNKSAEDDMTALVNKITGRLVANT